MPRGIYDRSRTEPQTLRSESLTETPRKRERKRKGGDGADKYTLPAETLARFEANGQSVEWKRDTIYGARDPGYEVELREQGWEPVDASVAPELMPTGYKGPITLGGMILMERPKELTAEARAEQVNMARDAVRIREAQMGATPAGTLTRDHATAQPQIRHSVERGPIAVE